MNKSIEKILSAKLAKLDISAKLTSQILDVIAEVETLDNNNVIVYKGNIINRNDSSYDNCSLWAEKLMEQNNNLVTWSNTKYNDEVAQINLPVGITCNPKADCFAICYAKKGKMGTPSNVASHLYHLAYYHKYKRGYFERISAEITVRPTTKFRWHSSGDIVDMEYLDGMVWLAKQHKSIQFLCYTKKMFLVNEYETKHKIPKNLVIVASEGITFTQENPNNRPVAYIKGVSAESDAKIPETAFVCPAAKSGKCGNCQYCFNMKKGDAVAFIKH